MRVYIPARMWKRKGSRLHKTVQAMRQRKSKKVKAVKVVR